MLPAPLDALCLCRTRPKRIHVRTEAENPPRLGSQIHLSPYVLQALTTKADVLGLLNSAEDMTNSLKQASEFGFRQNGRQIAAPLVNITDIRAMGLDVAGGLTFLTAFIWDRTEATRRFSQRFFSRHQAIPTMPQAAVYSGTLHYLKAIAAAGSAETGPVLAAMRANRIHDFYAEDGWIRVDGRMMHDMYLVQVKTPAESKGPWDYHMNRSGFAGG